MVEESVGAKLGNLVGGRPQSVVEFTPPDLNKGEWLEMQMLVDGDGAYPTITSRIRGETRPTASTVAVERRRRWWTVYPLGAIALAAMIFGQLIIPAGHPVTDTRLAVARGLWAFYFVCGLAIAMVVIRERRMLSPRDED